jgi:hypothetical protein
MTIEIRAQPIRAQGGAAVEAFVYERTLGDHEGLEQRCPGQKVVAVDHHQ